MTRTPGDEEGEAAVDRNHEAAADDPDTDDKPLGRDDPISLWPLSFEEVVRALHKTPPMKRDKGDHDGQAED